MYAKKCLYLQYGIQLPMAGMRPLGLILRNQSSFCSFFDKEMGCTLHFKPSSSIKMLAFQPFGVPAVYKVMPFLSDILLNLRFEPAYACRTQVSFSISNLALAAAYSGAKQPSSESQSLNHLIGPR